MAPGLRASILPQLSVICECRLDHREDRLACSRRKEDRAQLRLAIKKIQITRSLLLEKKNYLEKPCSLRYNTSVYRLLFFLFTFSCGRSGSEISASIRDSGSGNNRTLSSSYLKYRKQMLCFFPMGLQFLLPPPMQHCTLPNYLSNIQRTYT